MTTTLFSVAAELRIRAVATTHDRALQKHSKNHSSLESFQMARVVARRSSA
jgi:hypothetical protein